MDKILFIAVIFIALASAHPTVDSRQQEKIQSILSNILTPSYNTNLRPYGVNGANATNVGVYLRNLDIVDVDEVNGRLTIQTFFRQEWVDERLSFNDSELRYIPLRDCKTIWIPDLYFETGLDSLNSLAKPIRVLQVYPNGRVFYSVRLTQTINCPALLNPEVKQVNCQSGILSYGYRSEDILVSFQKQGENGFNLVKDVVLRPRFALGPVTTRNTCNLAEQELAQQQQRTARGHNEKELNPISCVSINFLLNRV